MSDTPETDATARRPTVGDATRYVVSREFAESLERQRDAYAETLREIVKLAAEWQGGSERFIGANEFIELATRARALHPELAQEASQP